jgi:hypothetical protein
LLSSFWHLHNVNCPQKEPQKSVFAAGMSATSRRTSGHSHWQQIVFRDLPEYIPRRFSG